MRIVNLMGGEKNLTSFCIQVYQVPPRLQRPPPPFASCSPESSEIVRFLFQREDSQLIYPLPSPHPPGLTTRFSFVDSKIQIHPIYRISCYYCRCYCCCYQPDLSAVTQQPSRLPVLSRRDKSSLPSHAHTLTLTHKDRFGPIPPSLARHSGT